MFQLTGDFMRLFVTRGFLMVVLLLGFALSVTARCPAVDIKDYQLERDTWTQTIKGTALNASDTDYDWVEIHFLTLDRNGNKISSPKSYNSDVSKGQNFKFEATVLSETIPVDVAVDKKVCL
ncbi:MAG: FxLYD domain-containing protein [bacterium]